MKPRKLLHYVVIHVLFLLTHSTQSLICLHSFDCSNSFISDNIISLYGYKSGYGNQHGMNASDRVQSTSAFTLSNSTMIQGSNYINCLGDSSCAYVNNLIAPRISNTDTNGIQSSIVKVPSIDCTEFFSCAKSLEIVLGARPNLATSEPVN